MKLKSIINKNIVFLLFGILLFSCAKPTRIPLLVSSAFLQNIDTIKVYNPYQFDNGVNQISFSNLPENLRKMKGDPRKASDTWNKIRNVYGGSSIINVDSIDKSKIVVHRRIENWINKEGKLINNPTNIKEFKELMSNEGINHTDYEIFKEKQIEWTGGTKSDYLELKYMGTINCVTINKKGNIRISTYLESQIDYWKSRGKHFTE